MLSSSSQTPVSIHYKSNKQGKFLYPFWYNVGSYLSTSLVFDKNIQLKILYFGYSYYLFKLILSKNNVKLRWKPTNSSLNWGGNPLSLLSHFISKPVSLYKMKDQTYIAQPYDYSVHVQTEDRCTFLQWFLRFNFITHNTNGHGPQCIIDAKIILMSWNIFSG